MYFWSDSSAYPCAMTWKQSLWWRFMPGVVINVRWPRGWVVIEEHSDGTRVGTDSADPNDHYRPWLEANVGRQGWDWDWGMADTDATLDRLTIKIRRSQARLATIAVMRWA
jgi:hypothetical protein